jgi:hypothetical protein
MGDSRSEQRLWHVQCAASLLRSWKTSFNHYIVESDPCTHGQLYVALALAGGRERVRAMHQCVNINNVCWHATSHKMLVKKIVCQEGRAGVECRWRGEEVQRA